ncbi:uncharacterized protein BDFB_000160, partial [Asbolus verrucosus]
CTEDNGNDIQAEHDKVLKNETNDDDNNQVENEPKTSDNNCAKIDEHSNSLALNYIEFDPSDYVVIGDHVFGEYDNTDQIPLPQLLKIHVKQLVSGFEFGEATKRRAQENMKTARDKKMNENRMSGEITEKVLDDTLELEQPCCSKTLSERDHKTPHSHKRQRLAEARVCSVSSDKDFCKGTRRVPDCLLEYPDCIEVWVYMIYKEEAAIKLRNPRLFNDFKSVTPRMRAILLDWLMEVAEVYHLRRVTYYLSVDYFDRFLSIRPDIPKSLLQLVGITCLYIAAKVEEIYPPNLSEFSYVCDGACKSKEMVSCELLILNSLGWEVVLTTPSDWLNLYMQLHFKSKDIVRTTLNMDFNKDFIFPQYSAYQFTRASQLMDLFSLDPGFLKFGYSVIAAGAMYFMYGKKIALSVSGLTWQQLQPCADYMEAFYMVIKDAPDPRLHSCLGGPHPEELNRPSTGLLNRIKTGPQNENYSFQTHVACMDYFPKMEYLQYENIWITKNIYEEAEIKYYENLAKASVTPLAGEVAKARQLLIESRDSFKDAPAPEPESVDLAINTILKRLQQLELRVTNIEKIAAKPPQPIPPVKKVEKTETKADDDDVDLFGSDSEEETDAAAKIREERLAAYNAKKSKKPALIAKSNVILDVKPWDDETDMKELESQVRKISSDGLLWGAAKLVPLAYGIHKLQISCVVEDEKISIDWLQDEITAIEDYVQSVDIAAFNKI